jgi:hypothetical protein
VLSTFTPDQQHIVDEYILTGNGDGQSWIAWPGQNIIEKMQAASNGMRGALVAEVRSREKNGQVPAIPTPEELVVLTRQRVEPMVRGFFPATEQPIVLGLLEKSVVFVTPENIERLVHNESFDHSAWTIANLYLASIGAKLLGPEAPNIVGFSQETTCFVSPEYLSGRGRFDDFVVHETAHIFHNWKREYAGMPFTRKKEWLLEIEYRKRETFAYSCEVFSRIVEQGLTAKQKAALLEQYTEAPFCEERVDLEVHIDILREAVKARNGWKRILAGCAPPGRRRRPMATTGT